MRQATVLIINHCIGLYIGVSSIHTVERYNNNMENEEGQYGHTDVGQLQGRTEVDYSVIFLLHVRIYKRVTHPLYTSQEDARMPMVKYQDFNYSRY